MHVQREAEGKALCRRSCRTCQDRLLPGAVQSLQVLYNLLGNSLKFTSKGSVGLHVVPSDDKKDVLFKVSNLWQQQPVWSENWQHQQQKLHQLDCQHKCASQDSAVHISGASPSRIQPWHTGGPANFGLICGPAHWMRLYWHAEPDTSTEAHDIIGLVMKQQCCPAMQVQDTGIGIAEDKLQSIFVPFEQVSGLHRKESVQQLLKAALMQRVAFSR